jgi:hypothetical protein
LHFLSFFIKLRVYVFRKRSLLSSTLWQISFFPSDNCHVIVLTHLCVYDMLLFKQYWKLHFLSSDNRHITVVTHFCLCDMLLSTRWRYSALTTVLCHSGWLDAQTSFYISDGIFKALNISDDRTCDYNMNLQYLSRHYLKINDQNLIIPSIMLMVFPEWRNIREHVLLIKQELL